MDARRPDGRAAGSRPADLRAEDGARVRGGAVAGVRTAQRESIDPARAESLRRFCRFVGVAYQLLNDLKDWGADRRDKLVAGQDSLARRPTMLLALALEAGDAATFRKLASVTEPDVARELKLESLRKVYEERGAFDKARKLVEKYRERARAEADAMRPRRCAT